MQVVRVRPIFTPNTKLTNDRYRKALAGTVWANYQLVVTQWPTRTTNPAATPPTNIAGDPFPPDASTTSVGNTTMETYFQDVMSCMECHDGARLALTDFVWFVNLRAQPPDPGMTRRMNLAFRSRLDRKQGFHRLLSAPRSASAANLTVTGINPAQWTIPGDSTITKPATINDATGRMEVPVADGDVVEFAVTSGNHKALFEHAKTEQAAGVWEIVDGTGSLVDLPAGQFPHYDHADAQSTVEKTGTLIQIRIKALPAGKTILFACNPHSESINGKNVPMLGALVHKP